MKYLVINYFWIAFLLSCQQPKSSDHKIDVESGVSFIDTTILVEQSKIDAIKLTFYEENTEQIDLNSAIAQREEHDNNSKDTTIDDLLWTDFEIGSNRYHIETHFFHPQRVDISKNESMKTTIILDSIVQSDRYTGEKLRLSFFKTDSAIVIIAYNSKIGELNEYVIK